MAIADFGVFLFFVQKSVLNANWIKFQQKLNTLFVEADAAGAL